MDIERTINPLNNPSINNAAVLDYYSGPMLWFRPPHSRGFDSFLAIVQANYQFGVYEMHGGKINDEGWFCYPEDPDLIPLIKLESEKEKMYFYECAIVAIVPKDSKDPIFVTRID